MNQTVAITPSSCVLAGSRARCGRERVRRSYSVAPASTMVWLAADLLRGTKRPSCLAATRTRCTEVDAMNRDERVPAPCLTESRLCRPCSRGCQPTHMNSRMLRRM